MAKKYEPAEFAGTETADESSAQLAEAVPAQPIADDVAVDRNPTPPPAAPIDEPVGCQRQYCGFVANRWDSLPHWECRICGFDTLKRDEAMLQAPSRVTPV